MENIEMPTLEELQEINDDYCIEDFLPNHIIIGSNGNGELYGIDNSGNYFNVPIMIDKEDVEIHTALPLEERIADYIHQVKNPYCHISNGMIVKISFAGKDTLEECLSRCISAEKKF